MADRDKVLQAIRDRLEDEVVKIVFCSSVDTEASPDGLAAYLLSEDEEEDG